jgi:hypothetical protein
MGLGSCLEEVSTTWKASQKPSLWIHIFFCLLILSVSGKRCSVRRTECLYLDIEFALILQSFNQNSLFIFLIVS